MEAELALILPNIMLPLRVPRRRCRPARNRGDTRQGKGVWGPPPIFHEPKECSA